MRFPKSLLIATQSAVTLSKKPVAGNEGPQPGLAKVPAYSDFSMSRLERGNERREHHGTEYQACILREVFTIHSIFDSPGVTAGRATGQAGE
jgi:hypothetical protein